MHYGIVVSVSCCVVGIISEWPTEGYRIEQTGVPYGHQKHTSYPTIRLDTL